MTKEEILSKYIKTYWWNHGTKTADFDGTYKEWFETHGITVRQSHKYNKLYFKGSYGSMGFDIVLNRHYMESFNVIIKFCLTFLGDKALLIDGYNREYKINWQ